jgi:exonuclease VII small subunit
LTAFASPHSRQFHAALGEGNKFYELLLKIFKKKIKRQRKGGLEGDGGEEYNSEDEDEDEDAMDSDEELEDEDEEVCPPSCDHSHHAYSRNYSTIHTMHTLAAATTRPFTPCMHRSVPPGCDHSHHAYSGSCNYSTIHTMHAQVCPPGCDPALYEKVCELREKHLEQEDVYSEFQKGVELLKKENDMLIKKEKIIDKALRDTEADIQSFQTEKQRKLNELHVVVTLQMSQV